MDQIKRKGLRLKDRPSARLVRRCLRDGIRLRCRLVQAVRNLLRKQLEVPCLHMEMTGLFGHS